MNTIEDRVSTIVVDHLGVEPARVIRTARIQNDLGGDSLDAIELCMAVEDAFNIEISDPEIDGIKTVGELVDLVSTKLKGE